MYTTGQMDRFWSKVAKSDGCWEWTASRLPQGYGQFWDKGKMRRASRIAWELTNGPIPPGLHVCHRCDNPPCVRPSHLFLGTHQENMADRESKGRTPPRPPQPRPERRARGAAHPRTATKLDGSRVRGIRALAAVGVVQTDLANWYGVDQAAISRIVTRRNWRHV